jgi:hypothetical protein
LLGAGISIQIVKDNSKVDRLSFSVRFLQVLPLIEHEPVVTTSQRVT